MEWAREAISSIWLQVRSIYKKYFSEGQSFIYSQDQSKIWILLPTTIETIEVHTRHRHFEDKWRLKDSCYSNKYELRTNSVHRILDQALTRYISEWNKGPILKVNVILLEGLNKYSIKKKKVNITEARYKCTLISEGCYLRLAHNDSNSKQKIMIQCEVQNLLWRFRGKWHLKSFNTERILKVLRTEGPFWGFKDIKKINAKSRL